jgi:2-polyprenyl-3-methyl-5-hydroxy-6-metoxy-1,4-benzoquinol methylase
VPLVSYGDFPIGLDLKRDRFTAIVEAIYPGNAMSEQEKERHEIADYYDVFSNRLIGDFVNGNRRIAKAIDRVKSVITPQDRKILDIGCGIGISTAEYIESHPHLHATGVDISPVNIQVAQSLFPSSQIKFAVSNLTDGVVEGKFDVIALLDVYEHVPRQEWTTFNAVLNKLLNERGRIVITTPSDLHQEYLKKHYPEALQIVDETVFFEDVLQLARDTRTTVVVYEIVSVFRSNDYLHLVLDRNPICDHMPPRSVWDKIRHKASRALSLFPGSSRSRRLRKAAAMRSILNQEKNK